MRTRLEENIKQLCREYQSRCTEVEQREECCRLRRELEVLCREVAGRLDIAEPGLLLAVMDAYEVTRDEGMLQEVLDVVGWNMERLAVSAEAVKLLAYCYYYVEEEECAVKAREMLKELKQKKDNRKEVGEAEKVVEELIV